MSSDKHNGRRQYKTFRKTLLTFTPFIRRSRHARVVARMTKHEVQLKKYLAKERETKGEMGRLFFAPPALATTAQCELRVPISTAATDELCLFVSHVASNQLKPFVVDHINALIDAGIAVVLIANVDAGAGKLQIPDEFAARLHGCLIRENVGYDFAAWAHGYQCIDAGSVRRRLYLINDSIVGPLDAGAYRSLLERIRASQADIIGLTANPDPHNHLQSYYIVFNERLLHSDACDSFMRRVVNLPLKQNVIDCYEVWLSPFMEEMQFRSEAIFPALSTEKWMRNDTIFRWAQLLELGFPFIKGMVLKDPFQAAAARRMLPARYL